MTFWFLWGVDAVVALIFLTFFFIGLGDGTVSSFNIVLWLGTLGVLGVVVGGSLWLRNAGRMRVAMSLVLALAIPSLLVGLFFLAILIMQPRWN